ncbi:hypothetical protein AB0F11_07810, partial [Streptomyces sp. NPDC032472]
MYNPTVARLTYRALLGRRRALILFALPALLIVISAVVGARNRGAGNIGRPQAGGEARPPQGTHKKLITPP